MILPTLRQFFSRIEQRTSSSYWYFQCDVRFFDLHKSSYFCISCTFLQKLKAQLESTFCLHDNHYVVLCLVRHTLTLMNKKTMVDPRMKEKGSSSERQELMLFHSEIVQQMGQFMTVVSQPTARNSGKQGRFLIVLVNVLILSLHFLQYL
jgi:hypothetical protein